VNALLERHRLHSAIHLREIATAAVRSLARIARAHEEYAAGRITAERLIEVVRQETARTARHG
jgi:hypothetical protein